MVTGFPRPRSSLGSAQAVHLEGEELGAEGLEPPAFWV
jgi:hypothetical protein